MSAAEKDQVSLEVLAARWLEAKVAEVRAIERRREIDQQIVEITRDPSKDEGTISKDVGPLKVSVTFGISRKADTGKLDEQWNSLPDTVKAAFRWSADVATKEFKALSGDDKDTAVAFVESKPSSPSVKVSVT